MNDCIRYSVAGSQEDYGPLAVGGKTVLRVKLSSYLAIRLSSRSWQIGSLFIVVTSADERMCVEYRKVFG
ncbi:hypothetical protein Clim_0729 [Chlorobium limicola DSM 245]|uniref:Uncharacterized protein n=1 Tax=Chlorobium limicola (strain DSM 245 / NBRC 103803 / 6330) TaxID=290315 RepID=B3EHN0_CHLL2|nr:hypothetical protein Clim_0729 [Chlorobium limicola DSM 245]